MSRIVLRSRLVSNGSMVRRRVGQLGGRLLMSVGDPPLVEPESGADSGKFNE